MPHDAAQESLLGTRTPGTLLRGIRLAGFRCFESLEYEPGASLNFITGPNARGKTSILEAACVLLRLRSPRTVNLAEAVRFGGSAFGLEGMVEAQARESATRLSLTCTPPSRLLKLDGVPQFSTADYLSQGRIVWFGGEDLLLVNGPAERRRKLLDSAALQMAPPGGGPACNYGRDLKSHDRALKSRNLLLREGRPRREIESYNIPLAEAGDHVIAARAALVSDLSPLAAAACRDISGEELELTYLPGASAPMLEALMVSREEEIRLRQTRVGPQRDDVAVRLDGIPAGPFASEGQRRTVALALKLAVAALLTRHNHATPLLLLDDIFGELDPSRRDALLAGMPAGSQALLTTADLSGISLPEGSRIHRIGNGALERVA
jgi:DNA replication and repair protein RecF